MSELYAFPQGNEWMDHEGNMRLIHEGGITLRDYFAGQALAMSQPDTPAALANWAYRVADAMLAERKSREADRAFKEAGL